MATLPNGRVVPLRSGAAIAAVHRELRQARAAIDAALAGDIDAVFTGHRAVNRAVGLVLDNRLATAWPNCPTCPTCGAEVSQGKCWGCGAPPRGRAS